MSRRHGATWPPFETSPVAGARVLLSASEPAGAAGVSRRCPGRSWTPSRDRGRRDAPSLPEAGSLALKRRPMHPYGSICLSELHGNCRPGPGGTGGNWGPPCLGRSRTEGSGSFQKVGESSGVSLERRLAPVGAALAILFVHAAARAPCSYR
jgi:hypothetical protein